MATQADITWLTEQMQAERAALLATLATPDGFLEGEPERRRRS